MAAELQATLTQFATISRAVILTQRGTCFNDLSDLGFCLADLTQPYELTKMILSETSIDGPALWSVATTQAHTVASAIAWTGTDPSHRLNVMTSTDGLAYTNKLTLGETSIARPAIVRMSDAAGGVVALAWTGTDPAHRVNVLFDVYGEHPQKLTLNEESMTAPAITIFNGQLLVAWTGTDPGHHLNVLPIMIGAGLRAGTKTTLRDFQSKVGPGLVTDITANPSQLLLTWISLPPALMITFSTSTDGVRWANAETPDRPELSASTPSMLTIQSTDMPRDYWAWTGTSGKYSLNIAYTVHFHEWPMDTPTHAILGESCLGGPVLGFTGALHQLLFAWTGTDPAHHLNVATLQV